MRFYSIQGTFKQNYFYIQYLILEYFQILINGEAYCEFPQRIAYDRVNNIAVEGDVSVELISQEVEKTIGFKQAEAEAPPPSYSELQSKYAPHATNYGSCSLPIAAPYPTNPTFVAAIPGYQPYPVQTGIYPAMQSGTMVPLNAASSNFRPVSNNCIYIRLSKELFLQVTPSKRKKYVTCACVLFVIMIIIVVGVFNNSTRRRHHHRHDHDHDWEY